MGQLNMHCECCLHISPINGVENIAHAFVLRSNHAWLSCEFSRESSSVGKCNRPHTEACSRYLSLPVAVRHRNSLHGRHSKHSGRVQPGHDLHVGCQGDAHGPSKGSCVEGNCQDLRSAAHVAGVCGSRAGTDRSSDEELSLDARYAMNIQQTLLMLAFLFSIYFHYRRYP